MTCFGKRGHKKGVDCTMTLMETRKGIKDKKLLIINNNFDNNIMKNIGSPGES